MPDPLWEALLITLTVPFAYALTSKFPLLSAFIISSVLYKN